MESTVKERKKQIRQEIRMRIDNLDGDYIRSADRQILDFLHALPDYRNAENVFCFAGSKREIDTMPFLQQALDEGREVAVPLCIRNHVMEARMIRSLRDLKKGSYGLLEPDKEAKLLIPQEIQFAVVPCLSCTYEGVRLGQGGGYYDTYFAAHPHIHAVMICRDVLVRNDIPREEHDIRFDWVITEKGVFYKGKQVR